MVLGMFISILGKRFSAGRQGQEEYMSKFNQMEVSAPWCLSPSLALVYGHRNALTSMSLKLDMPLCCPFLLVLKCFSSNSGSFCHWGRGKVLCLLACMHLRELKPQEKVLTGLLQIAIAILQFLLYLES